MTAVRRAVVLAAVVLLAAAPGQARAHDGAADEPWEPALEPAPIPAPPSGFSPLADLALAGIDHYRAVIGPRSISRCPFVCTCSAFARAAIARHGFWPGLALFFDRFFFRENRQLVQHYQPVVGDDGRLRFDDGPGATAAQPCP